MHPVLFSIGPFTVHSYGAMLALGLLAGVMLNSWLAKGNGFNPQRIQNATLWIMAAALIGTRIFYVLIEPAEFIDQPWRVFYIWEGGMVFYGGFIGGMLMCLWLARRWKMPIMGLLDNLVPGLALGQAFGRVGCFLAGCCYGQPWNGFCSVTFTDSHSLAPRAIALHPSQLYEAGGMFIVCVVLLLFWGKRRISGRATWLYGILAGMERIIAEQFRGDWRGTPLGPDGFFTPTIIIAICMLAISLVGFIILSKREV